MKILTLNTWQERGPWQERWEVALEGIERFSPEIICFQEFFNRPWSQEVQKRTAFPTLIFPEAYCGLVLCSRYPASSEGVVKLARSPLEDYDRYVLWVELKIKGEKLVILNTHFSWKPEDGVTRRKQVAEVLQLIAKKTPRVESLLMGDFNATPDTPEIQYLIQEGGLRDLFSALHPGEPGFSWDNRNPYAANCGYDLPDRRLDYILARGSGPLLRQLVSCDLVYTAPNARGVWASDHFGVLAEFQ